MAKDDYDDDMEQESGEKKKKGGGLKWIIIIVLLLAALGGGGYFVYTKFLVDKIPSASSEDQSGAQDGKDGAPAKAPEKGESTAGSKAGAPKDGQPGTAQGSAADTGLAGLKPLIAVPTFAVNLADPGGRRYLSLTISVEVPNPQVEEEFNKAMPQIRDNLLFLLSSLKADEVTSNEGKIELRTKIVERLNQVMGQGKVLRVFFTDLRIQ